MRRRQNTPLQIAARGLFGGMAGAIVLTGLLTVFRAASSTPDRDRDRSHKTGRGEQGITAGEALSEHPGLPPAIDRVTAIFVQKVATGIFGTSLTPRGQYFAGVAWHLVYGGFWGVVYAMVRSSADTPDLLLIPAHGLVVWLAGPGWLAPQMDLMLYPGEQRPRTLALMIGGHVTFSAAVALLFRWFQGSD
ncbi:MAG TPA: hypothetical protein VFJ58_10580 [Armatimonadota bacterium]|nr:hypothetical protein [Armatimonadota bacterium]